MHIKPFLKWAGGKYRVLDRILRALPSGTRLVEPFAGSCAVYLNLPVPAALVCDLNKDLIALYRQIQSEGEPFIDYCRAFFTPENNRKDAYIELRDRFNRSRDHRERAALLLYLNRHSFNGLVRYNAKGAFNVPCGAYKKPYFPHAELLAFLQKTRESDTLFEVADFRSAFTRLRPGDVVYCDPPYLPLSHTANFTCYAGRGFGHEDQRELAELAEKAATRGIPVIISNHDTQSARELYARARLEPFMVQRFISRDGSTRKPVPELLALFTS